MKVTIVRPRQVGYHPLAQPTHDVPTHLHKGGAARNWTQAELMSCAQFMAEHLAMVRSQVTHLGVPESFEGERAATLASAIKHLSFLQLAAGELMTELTAQQAQQ